MTDTDTTMVAFWTERGQGAEEGDGATVTDCDADEL